MKVIKIGAVWCGACLITNKSWNKILKDYSFDYDDLDIDMDSSEVSKYNPGDKLPLFIIMNDDIEINRFSGEFNYNELKEMLKKEGIINEENN